MVDLRWLIFVKSAKKVVKMSKLLKCQKMLTTNQNIINDFGRHFMVNKGHFKGLDKSYRGMLS